jgi:hypothetical protein
VRSTILAAKTLSGDTRPHRNCFTPRNGANLACLPTRRIAPAVEACDHYSPILLNLEEYPVGETPYSCAATVPVDDRKLNWMLYDCLNRGLDCSRETLPKLGADVAVPCPRILQILIRLRYPDDRESHGFLNRPALTCSQEITSEGFCSCRVMR